MKNAIISRCVAVATLLSLAPVPQYGADVRKLSLKEAVELAISQNHSLRIARLKGAYRGHLVLLLLLAGADELRTLVLIGGIAGIAIGLALPYSVHFFTEYHIPISGWSAIIAIVVSSLVGVIFGTVPATRAAQLDPVESLRYE